MKKLYVKLGIVSMMIVGTVLLTAFLSYAWFVRYVPTKPIIIQTGSLKTEAMLYRAIDPDFDGVFSDYEAVGEAFDFEAAIPGQIYSFKFEIKNTGTINGNLSLIMKDIIAEDILSQSFTVRYVDPKGGERTLSFYDDLDEDSQNITLFNEVELRAKDTLVFKFQIMISGDVNKLQGLSMKISNYAVQLDQIRSN